MIWETGNGILVRRDESHYDVGAFVHVFHPLLGRWTE